MEGNGKLIWIKKYLMSKKNTQFYEIRKMKNFALINRTDMNIGGYHLSQGAFDCQNELKAVYEYIERLCCHSLGEREEQKTGRKESLLSFDDLGFTWTGQSFNPLKDEVRYAEGISLKTREIYRMPSVFAYYLDNNFEEWQNFAGNSNGNAVGSSLEDAIERGILEFMERDKFIKYWYLNEGELLKIPEKFLGDKQKKLVYFHEKGYQVDFFSIENQPKEIFTIWCLIRSTDRRNRHFSFTGLGADIILEKAIEKAFTEVEAAYYFYTLQQETEKKEIKETLYDSIQYYFSYEREEEFQRIFKGMEKVRKDEKEWESQSKYSAAQIAMEYYQDVIYVPIQSKILKDLGLYEVKAVGIGGNNLYFDCSEKVRHQGKIPKYCPLA